MKYVESFLLVIVLSTTVVWAQTGTTGSISGTVHDQNGAVVPNVKVTVKSAETGLTRDTVSGSDGEYFFQQLTAGTYRFEFAATGFGNLVREAVVVRSGDKLTFDVQMQVGSIAEQILISGGADMVQASTSTMGKVLDDAVLRQPLPTRNYLQLQLTAPGVTANIADTAALGRGSINVSVNGARFNNNSYLIEGIDAKNLSSNTANAVADTNGVPVPALEAIQEVQLQTSLYDAQWGRNGGASVNMLLRGGTNLWHGNLYYFFRNEALNANNFFFNQTGTKRPILRQNLYGGSVGGPVRKDRTFFFISYQGARQLNGASLASSVAQLRLPPIPSDRSRSSLGQVFGGQAGLRGGVRIATDGSNINPVALALLNLKFPNGNFVIPSPQTTGSGTNYTVSIPAKYSEKQLTLSLDHYFSSNDKVGARFFWAHTPQELPFGQVGLLPGFGRTQDFRNRFFSATYQKILSPSLINDLRFGINQLPGTLSAEEPVTLEQIGMSRFNSSSFPGIPQISVGNQFAVGPWGASGDAATDYTSFTWADTLSYTKGSHLIRTGAEFRKHHSDLFNNFVVRGFISIPTFADFLLGMDGATNGTGFSNLQQTWVGSGPTDKKFRIFDWSAFVQDDWKVNPRLTLNLGLRYDFFGPVTDARGQIGNFDPALHQPAPPGGSSTAGLILAGNFPGTVPGFVKGEPSTLLGSDRKNFAPRLGFAYQPFSDSKVVVRGGYGIMYEQISTYTPLQLITTPPFFLQARQINPVTATLQSPFPVLPNASDFPVPIEYFSPPFTAARPTLSLANVSRNLRTPYIQQYNLGVQYQVANDWLVELAYVGSKGDRLPVRRQANQALLASPQNPINGQTTNTTANITLRVPYLGFATSGINQIETTTTSLYNAMQFRVSKRLNRGFQLAGHYTLSKSLDNNSGPALSSSTGDLSGDQTIISQARGRSDFDSRHTANISGYYQIPALIKNNAVARKFFSGWEMLAQYTARSGQPFSITDPTGATLHGISFSRANFAPGKTLEDAVKTGRVQDRLNEFFNRSAFAPAGQFFGNTGRNILSGPAQWNVDFSIVKRISITERQTVDFRTEVFNLFNHVNFAQPEGNFTSANFGRILATSSNARVIQFALKYNF